MDKSFSRPFAVQRCGADWVQKVFAAEIEGSVRCLVPLAEACGLKQRSEPAHGPETRTRAESIRFNAKPDHPTQLHILYRGFPGDDANSRSPLPVFEEGIPPCRIQNVKAYIGIQFHPGFVNLHRYRVQACRACVKTIIRAR